MASTFVHTEVVQGVLVARILTEKVAEREAQVLLSELAASAKANRWKVALDTSEVMMLASVGLGALVTLNKDCKAGGGKLVVFGVTDDIREVLRITRLERVLTIVKDREAALKALA